MAAADRAAAAAADAVGSALCSSGSLMDWADVGRDGTMVVVWCRAEVGREGGLEEVAVGRGGTADEGREEEAEADRPMAETGRLRCPEAGLEGGGG